MQMTSDWLVVIFSNVLILWNWGTHLSVGGILEMVAKRGRCLAIRPLTLVAVQNDTYTVTRMESDLYVPISHDSNMFPNILIYFGVLSFVYSDQEG